MCVWRPLSLNSISTNEEARRLAAGGRNWPAVDHRARAVEGRGRRGDAWVSDRGNLFATLLLQIFHATAAQLGFAASLAAADTITAHASTIRVHLKWPNDVRSIPERRHPA